MLANKAALARTLIISILLTDDILTIGVEDVCHSALQAAHPNHLPTSENNRIITLTTPAGVASQIKANPDSYSAKSQADGVFTERLHKGQVEEVDDGFEKGESSSENHAEEFLGHDRQRKQGGDWVGRIPQAEAQASRLDVSVEKEAENQRRGQEERRTKKGGFGRSLLKKSSSEVQNRKVGTSDTGRQDFKEEMDEVSSLTRHFKFLGISRREVELEWENKREKRLRKSFQPRESANPGEIYPGVIKGQWSDVVDTLQHMLNRVEDIAKRKPASALHGRSDKGTKLSRHETISRFALNFFERQLHLSNPDDHLSLQELSDETYKTLKFAWNSNPEGMVQGMEQAAAIHPRLSRYEFHRRIVTLTTQITQKTILENWLLTKKVLEEGQLKVPRGMLNKFQDHYMLTHEFPDVFVWSEKYFSKEQPNWNRLTKKGQDPSNLYLEVVGSIELHRRLRGKEKYIITKPQWNLSTKLLEEAKQAEKTNGVNIWNIAHVIHLLGLGEQKNWELCEDIEISNRVIVLDQLLAASWYYEIPWFQSADRAWLKRTFKDHYHQQFNSLCRTAAERLYKHDRPSSSHVLDQTDKFGTEISRGDILILQILYKRFEQRLMVREHGLDEKILLKINLLKDQNTHTDGHTIDWGAVWSSWPSEWVELDAEQREFAAQWLHNAFVGTMGNIINS